MTLAFLILLALAWIFIFLPTVRQARARTPFSSAERFKRRMSLIAPPRATNRGRWVLVPEAPDRLARSAFRRSQRRRRNILVGLIATCLVSIPLAALAGGGMWVVQLGADASLGIYVVLLLDAKRRRLERTQKVRDIAPATSQDEDFAFFEPAAKASR